MAKGVMHKFKINEISGVDRPAQGPARMAIIKRDGGDAPILYLAKSDADAALPAHVDAYLKRDFSEDKRKELASSGAALPDGSFPIETRSDLRNAVSAFGRAKNKPKAKAHIISRARTLGATSSLPDDWKATKFAYLTNITGDEVVAGFGKALEAFTTEQTAAGVANDVALAKNKDYANALLTETGICVAALKSAVDEIEDDAEVTNKSEALQESFSQFIGHMKGITAEGIENGLIAASLSEAGFGIGSDGALAKRETEMGFDIRKSLGLPAAASDAEVEKAMTDKLEAFGKADVTAKTLGNILKMSSSHTSFMNNEKAKMPSGGKEAFANMSAEDRTAHMKANPLSKAARKAAGDDEDDEDEDETDANKCLKVDGRVIKKSVVGEDVFAVMKSQQASIEKAEEAAAVAGFSKRADTSMALIGKSDELATLLRSVQKSAGNDVAEAVAKKFEQLNEVIKKGGGAIFKEVGGSNTGGDGSFAKASAQIETIAKSIVAAEKVSIFKARVLARDRNQDLAKQESTERAEAAKAA